MLQLMFCLSGIDVRTIINLDDDLLATASMLTGTTDRTPLIRESLKAIIASESAQRLALMGATMPEFVLTPCRRLDLVSFTKPAA